MAMIVRNKESRPTEVTLIFCLQRNLILCLRTVY